MALVNRSFSVNITPGMMPPIVHVSEYDVGRAYTVSILDEQGNTFTIPSGTTASIEGTLNGSVGFTQSATVSNNQVSFMLSQSMTACSGKAWCKIKLTQNSQPIQTCAFILAVDRAGVEAETVIGAPGFEEQIQEAVENYLDTEGVVSPTVSITPITGGNRVTFTDAEHPQGQSIDVMDGTSVEIDSTLTTAGAAADAKAVGDKLVKFNSARNGLVPASGVKSDKKYYLAGNGKFEKIPFDPVACQNLMTILQSCIYDKDVGVNLTNLAEALGINSGGDGDDMTFQFGQSIPKGTTSRTLNISGFSMTEIRLVVALHSDFQQGGFFVVSPVASGSPYVGVSSTGDFYYSNQGSYPGSFSATPSNLVDFVGNEPKEVKIVWLNPSGYASRKYMSGLKFFFNNYNPSCGFTLFRISGYDGATKLFNLESTGTNGELYDTMTGTTYTFDNTSGMEIVEVEEE